MIINYQQNNVMIINYVNNQALINIIHVNENMKVKMRT